MESDSDSALAPGGEGVVTCAAMALLGSPIGSLEAMGIPRNTVAVGWGNSAD